MTDFRTIVDEILTNYNNKSSNLVMILQDSQTKLNYLSTETISYIADKLSVPEAQVYSVATFYKSFSLSPRGKHQINICEGTACHIRGASLLMNQAKDELGVNPGETTTDGSVTLNSVHCVGACAMGPVAVIDGEYHGNFNPSDLSKHIKRCCSENGESNSILKDSTKSSTSKDHLQIKIDSREKLIDVRKELMVKLKDNKKTILVCSGTGCLAKGSLKVATALENAITESQAEAEISLAVKQVGCHGLCEKGPLVIMLPDNTIYTGVKPDDANEIITETVLNGKIVSRLLYSDNDNNFINQFDQIPFYSSQKKIALRNVGQIDPLIIDDYVLNGGYSSLLNVLHGMKPSEVIEQVKLSGLRGRGGGGFPTGLKWETAAKINSDVRYVICNGDEGDPGAFMDCSIMEGDPHAIIEGMIICAYAVNAKQGYIYVREEYPRALNHISIAIEQAYKTGLLGKNIGGSKFSFNISLNRGAGAFICGESTALMQSVSGYVGEPRAKYIRSAERGLYDKPTVLNNVETFANIAPIIENSGDWFKNIGTSKSSGTKVFSLVGKVKNTGLVEVPMGTTLRSIIFDIGGGILDNKDFKAVQTGGPSGGCLPAKLLDLPVDFDSLTQEGSMMGSGGMIVMDENTCMVDIARYFTEFLTEESCGKCAACRNGLKRLSEILERICEGDGQSNDLVLLNDLLDVLEKGSLCGLGKSAPNPVRSTLNHFCDEYIAHIEEKKCPAGVCRNLINYIITDACTGCTVCAKHCPEKAISGENKKIHSIDQGKCTRCGICRSRCRFEAIIVE